MAGSTADSASWSRQCQEIGNKHLWVRLARNLVRKPRREIAVKASCKCFRGRGSQDDGIKNTVVVGGAVNGLDERAGSTSKE